MNKYIIYALSDPITNKIRYIGKSSNGKSRYNYHCSNNTIQKSRLPVHNWIRSLKKNNLKPIFLILKHWDYASDEEMNQAEIDFIKTYRNNGGLLNLSDGGDGSRGIRRTPAQIEQLIKYNKTRQITDELRLKLHLGAKNRIKNKPKNKVKLSTGEIFSGYKDVALFLGCSTSHVCLMIKRGMSYNNITVSKLGDSNE